MNEPFPHSVIAVGARSMCVWDQELTRHNLEFCSSFEAGWFLDAVANHLRDVEDLEAVSQSAALAVRQTYHQALEAFFALLFAFFQAPHCIPAWLDLYEFSIIRDLIRAVNTRMPILNAWRMPRPTWTDLAALTTRLGWPDDQNTADRYGLLWQRLASEYLDDQRAAEHAALKHGFRARASGGAIKIGIEPEYGVSPPPEMQWLGGSKHGSSTFVASPIPAGAGRRKALHYHLKVQNTLWLLDTTILKVQHLCTSMENVLGAARVRSGEAAEKIQFHRPQDPSAFDAPWRKSTGITGFGMSLAGPGEGVAGILADEVEAMMREASGLLQSEDEGGTAT